MAAVVPLLSHFPVSEHDSSSRSFTYTKPVHNRENHTRLCHASHQKAVIPTGWILQDARS